MRRKHKRNPESNANNKTPWQKTKVEAGFIAPHPEQQETLKKINNLRLKEKLFQIAAMLFIAFGTLSFAFAPSIENIQASPLTVDSALTSIFSMVLCIVGTGICGLNLNAIDKSLNQLDPSGLLRKKISQKQHHQEMEQKFEDLTSTIIGKTLTDDEARKIKEIYPELSDEFRDKLNEENVRVVIMPDDEIKISLAPKLAQLREVLSNDFAASTQDSSEAFDRERGRFSSQDFNQESQVLVRQPSPAPSITATSSSIQSITGSDLMRRHSI